MKKFIFFIILLFYSNPLKADQSIKYVDLDKLLQNSNKGKIVVSEIKNINTKNINELKKKENELKELENEIKKISNIISEEELNIKITDLKKKIKLYKKYQKDKSNEFYKIKNEKIEIFFKESVPLIEKYMKDNNISIIVDKKNIFIANSNYDITLEIIEILNKQK